ncbi:RecQ family ATP-dependent DNA helicase [Allofournierella sp.]|uniref:RecQ family ATP-dependent DNA helicase n=1 Tax=Allofournierella sp. TaxID=1940256 RepID=UPI003AB8CC03
MSMEENQKYSALQSVFGYSSFRPGQEEVVDALLAGRDVLAVMPTGAGKSICYQLPALLLPGVTVVVSPLISLMKDQVQALVQMGVRAAYINSSLTDGQCRKALENACAGMYKIVYVAPERLLTPGFVRFSHSVLISLVCVDEAHCVSQWGQDFRPGYLQIGEFLEGLHTRPPLGAFTATATQRVRQDILRLLALRSPLELTTGFDRPNLFFEVERLPEKDKYAALAAYLRARPGASGIVYCSTRKKVDEVCARLLADGFSAARYHAGLEPEPRRQSQDAFLYDRVQVMVATNAFGMGIDKSNVNFVIHYNMPLDLESYYQEAGRAGRDGQPADCILLYSPGDVRMGNFLIDNSSPAEGEDEDVEVLKDRQRERLKQMTFYCHSRYCLRGEVLRYFGQAQPFASCGACSVCAPDACRAPVACLAARPAHRAAPPDERDLDQALLAQLKALRKTLAARAGVPAFVVFTDATLRSMCARPIRTRQELLQVPGVGVRKCESYGDEFLQLLRRHADGEQ